MDRNITVSLSTEIHLSFGKTTKKQGQIMTKLKMQDCPYHAKWLIRLLIVYLFSNRLSVF